MVSALHSLCSISRQKEKLERGWTDLPAWVFCTEARTPLDESRVRKNFAAALASGHQRFVDGLAGPKGQRATRKAGHQLGTKRKSGAPSVPEAPDSIGGPSRTRTLDPLIKSNSESISTEAHDDVKLEDLYTWH
jgi:hypothetical protein